MAVVTICSDFGAPKIKSVTISTFFPSICCEVMGLDAMIFVYWMSSFKPAFLLTSFILIKRLFSSSSLSDIRVETYVPLHIWSCSSNLDSSLWFIQPSIFMMYSAYKLNKQDDNIQPWHNSFPIWNQSVVSCPVLTVASWHAYKFPRRKVRWSCISISWKIFHTLLWSTQSFWHNQ